MTTLFRRARPSDFGTVAGLLKLRIDWLRSRGSVQWSTRDPLPAAEDAVSAGLAWLLFIDGRAVGTLTMTTIGDPAFWSDEERAQPALYLSKIATDPGRAGEGIGEMLVDAAALYGQRAGIPTLRWDVWRTNEALQSYYRDLGSQHLRTADVHGRHSGALFELSFRKSQTPIIIGADETDIAVPVPSTMRYPDELGEGSAVRYDHQLGQPDHWHITDQITSDPLWIGSTQDAQSALLIHNGDGWTLWQEFSPRPVTGQLNRLTPGRPYHLRHVDNGACQIIITD